ncbi:unnamed protein product [Cuscuta campestris]|uniref:Uncharacterized protein n=1 Tax=Cuscuta campestris TaxID=132261 RepID=A0A484MV62_9ASTE|nr:unnamed protein product [Cuscuta campestris]
MVSVHNIRPSLRTSLVRATLVTAGFLQATTLVTAAGFSDPSPDSLPLSIGDIEQILLNEDDDFGPVAGEGSFEEQDVGFDWSSLLLDSPCEASDSKCSSGGSEVEERDLVDPFQQKLDCVAQVLGSDNGDPVTKNARGN